MNNLQYNYHSSFFLLLLCIALPTLVAADDDIRYQDIPSGSGGPGSVSETLKDDVVTSGYRFDGLQQLLTPYFQWKETTHKDTGLAFATDYNTLYQKANESLTGEDTAFGGIFRLYGSWNLYKNDKGSTGNLVFKVENRHTIGSHIAPQNLGGEIGYSGLTGAQFGDSDGWILTNLFWQQKMNDGKLNVAAGILDPTDYVNLYGLVDPLKAFSNLAFLTGQTIPAPSQGGGIVLGWSPTDHYYMIGGIYDANADPSKPGDVFDSIFNDAEFFKQIEVGWFSSFDRRYLDNIHLTLWQIDQRDKAGIDDDWGVSFSATKFINDKWMPFFRAGYADGGAALFEKSVSIGIGYYFENVNDLLGVGLNWGEPSEVMFGNDIDDEKIAEVFYRLQLSPGMALTPDVQFIFDPAQNTNESLIIVYGLRFRVTL